MIKTVALLAAIALAPWQDADRGAIELRFGNGEKLAVAIIDPDGTLQIDQPELFDATVRIKERHVIGSRGYERIAALLKPARRWAGGKMPCDPDGLAFPRESVEWRPVAHVRWQADEAQVEVPVSCMHGPANDEIELVRAAVDEVKRWSNESEDAAFDGPANSVSYNATTGEPEL